MFHFVKAVAFLATGAFCLSFIEARVAPEIQRKSARVKHQYFNVF